MHFVPNFNNFMNFEGLIDPLKPLHYAITRI